jgi:hypothetical protein
MNMQWSHFREPLALSRGPSLKVEQFVEWVLAPPRVRSAEETPRLLFPSLLLMISPYLSHTSFHYLWNPHITLRSFLKFSLNCFPVDAFLINLRASRPGPRKEALR